MSREDVPEGRGLFRYRFGSAEFDQAQFVLTVDGRRQTIERRPLEVLEMLLHHVGEVVTPQELLDTVWDGRVTIKHVVPNAVAKLRKALGDANAAFIATQPRVGYRFTGPVERVAVGRQLLSQLALALAQAVPRRPDYVLEAQLKGSIANEIWMARHRHTGEPRVFKFCVDADGLNALKRELTVSRVLQESLGDETGFTRVLGRNFEEPPYYLELSYGGVDLLQFSVQQPGLTALPREQRIELAARIAEIVAAAHSVGVLHKDLKPANVLIVRDEDALTLRLTDFGSAKLLQPELLEALGISMVGMTLAPGAAASPEGSTPLYWAPEILAGGVFTISSDIYALGVLLFQILVGDCKRPFTPGWEQDIDDELLVADIASATARDPHHRLQNAAELAEGLRRLPQRRAEQSQRLALRDEHARAQAALAKARLRRPWVVTASTAIGVGLGLSLLFGWSAERARSNLQLQLSRVDAVNDFLNKDVLGAARLTQLDTGYNPSIKQILEQAQKRIHSKFTDDAYTKATIYHALAKAYASLQDAQVADQLFAEAIGLLHGRVAERDPLLLDLLYDRAVATILLGSKELASQQLSEADQLAGPLLQQDSRAALLSTMAHAEQMNLALDFEGLTALMPRAERLRQRVAAADLDLEFRVRFLGAEALYRTGKLELSEAEYRALLSDTRYSIDTLGVEWVGLQRRMGSTLRAQLRLVEALPYLQQAARNYEQLVGPLNSATTASLGLQAAALYELGQYDESLQLYEEIYRRVVEKHGEGHERAWVELANLASTRIELKQGDAQQNTQDLERALAGLIDTRGAEHASTFAVQRMLTRAYIDLARYPRALELVEGIAPERLARAMPGIAWPARHAAMKAEILLGLNRHAEALPMLRQAIADMRAAGMSAEHTEGYESMLAAHDISSPAAVADSAP